MPGCFLVLRGAINRKAIPLSAAGRICVQVPAGLWCGATGVVISAAAEAALCTRLGSVTAWGFCGFMASFVEGSSRAVGCSHPCSAAGIFPGMSGVAAAEGKGAV